MTLAEQKFALRSCVLAALVLAATLTPSIARAQWPPDSLVNLEVLPKDIETRELVNIMAGFTRALGVRCQFCHVGEEGIPLAQFDFPSDEKPTKGKAREMIRMVETINGDYLANLKKRAEPPVVASCATCHRGVRKPRPLQDVLTLAYEEGGLDAVLQEYTELRERYYGRSSYDFGVVTLTEVAGAIIRKNSLEDAVEILALNLRHYPDTPFAQRMFASRSIELAYRNEGPEAGNARFHELESEYGKPAFTEWDVNTLGHRLLRSGKSLEAVQVFIRYIQLYPESSEAYDSLGEAYMTHGDTEMAIRSYEKSLELDPGNANAAQKLADLEKGG